MDRTRLIVKLIEERARQFLGKNEKMYFSASFSAMPMSGDKKEMRLTGHPAVFGQVFEHPWGFTEEIMPGAFRQSIVEDDIRALFNHDPNQVLGRNKSGTMSLKEDDNGLYFDVLLPDTGLGRDLYTLVQRGDVSQGSIGFDTMDDQWSVKDGRDHRQLQRVKLWDASPVTFPAFTATDISARSAEHRSIVQLYGKIRAGLSLSKEELAAMDDLLPKDSISLEMAGRRQRQAEAQGK